MEVATAGEGAQWMTESLRAGLRKVRSALIAAGQSLAAAPRTVNVPLAPSSVANRSPADAQPGQSFAGMPDPSQIAFDRQSVCSEFIPKCKQCRILQMCPAGFFNPREFHTLHLKRGNQFFYRFH